MNVKIILILELIVSSSEIPKEYLINSFFISANDYKGEGKPATLRTEITNVLIQPVKSNQNNAVGNVPDNADTLIFWDQTHSTA